MKNTYQDEMNLLKDISEILSADAEQYLAAVKNSDPEMTKYIPNMVKKLAGKRDLKIKPEYYRTDFVLHKDEDMVTQDLLPNNTSCVDMSDMKLKRIRIAFEHENHLDKNGGYKEIAHLMIVNADLKVLMGYGDEGGENYDAYAKDYSCIFRSVNPPDSATPILLIGEYMPQKDNPSEIRDKPKDNPSVKLDAYLIAPCELLQFDWRKEEWSPLKS